MKVQFKYTEDIILSKRDDGTVIRADEIFLSINGEVFKQVISVVPSVVNNPKRHMLLFGMAIQKMGREIQRHAQYARADSLEIRKALHTKYRKEGED